MQEKAPVNITDRFSLSPESIVLDAPGGVYEILNTVNGKRYIGSSKNISKRCYEHKRTLRLKRHCNRKLQRAWDKYGEAAFEFSIVLRCPAVKALLLVHEQHFLDAMRPEYNIAILAQSCLGVVRPPEFGAKISARKKGVKLGPRPPEFGALISQLKKGKPLSPDAAKKAADQCAQMTAGNIGKKHTATARANMSKGQLGNQNTRGFKFPPERNAAVSKKLTGRKRPPFSQEWLDNMSKASRGKPKPLEWRLKMSALSLAKKRRPDGTFVPKAP